MTVMKHTGRQTRMEMICTAIRAQLQGIYVSLKKDSEHFAHCMIYCESVSGKAETQSSNGEGRIHTHAAKYKEEVHKLGNYTIFVCAGKYAHLLLSFRICFLHPYVVFVSKTFQYHCLDAAINHIQVEGKLSQDLKKEHLETTLRKQQEVQMCNAILHL
jgi:hypothetical protein